MMLTQKNVVVKNVSDLFEYPEVRPPEEGKGTQLFILFYFILLCGGYYVPHGLPKVRYIGSGFSLKIGGLGNENLHLES